MHWHSRLNEDDRDLLRMGGKAVARLEPKLLEPKWLWRGSHEAILGAWQNHNILTKSSSLPTPHQIQNEFPAHPNGFAAQAKQFAKETIHTAWGIGL